MTNAYNLAATFSVIICMYMMFFYDIIVEYEAAEFTSNSYIRLIKFSFSLVQLGFSLLYAYYWYKLKIWYKPERQSRDPPNEGGASVEDAEVAIETEPGLVDKIKDKIYGLFNLAWERIKNGVAALLARFNITIEFP